jgi:predicted dehydrogenase
MEPRLRVGIIGLDRRWRRALPPGLEVRVVCDPLAERARRAAEQLGCAAAGGVVELIERPDVEAVLLLGRPWYGLWSLERACQAGKPVLCAASLADEEEHADALLEQVRAAKLPVLVAPDPALLLLAEQLRVLLDGPLGPAGLLRVAFTGPLAYLSGPALVPLLAVCAQLLGSEPRAVRSTGAEIPNLASVVLEFGDRLAAQLTLWGVAAPRACRVEVVAARGLAAAEHPGRLCWQDATGRHIRQFPAAMAERRLLDRFAESLRAGQALRPSFEEAHTALRWLRAARTSLAEGRRVELG